MSGWFKACVEKMQGKSSSPVVRPLTKSEEDEFEKAFAEMVSRPVMHVSSNAAHGSPFIPISQGNLVRPTIIGLTDGQKRKLVAKIMLQLLTKVDSIMSNPEELAKQAWDLVDAVDKEGAKRL